MKPPRVAAALLAVALACGAAEARDIAVGGTGDHRTLEAAVFASSPGDRILVAPGSYQARDVRVPHDLTIEGRGGVTITSERDVAKGLFVPQADFTIRNVTLKGARSPDKNGAGIRHEGGDLLIEDVTFSANEDGVLATGAPDGAMTVRRSLFEDNGHGDGYSHAIYQNRGRSLLVEDSRFVGTRVGHHVKSLAPLVVVTRSSFDDGDGRTSYVVDATGGGRLIVSRNEIERRATADQDKLFNYDTSRGGALGSVTITDNAVTTHKRRTVMLRNPEGAPVTATGNGWATAGAGSYTGLPVEDGPAPAALRPSSGPADLGPPPPAPPVSAADIARLTPQQRRAARKVAAALDRAPAEAARTARATGLLAAPRIETPRDAFAAFDLEPSGPGTAWTTFGVPFAPGVLPAGQAVALALGTAQIPTQADVLATHPDGSVRHLALTFAYEGGGEARLVRSSPPSVAPLTGADLPTETVTVRGQGPDGPFQAAVTLGTDEDGAVWLSGPLVTERLESYALTPLLRLRADRRAYADGTHRTRLTFENHETFLPGGRSLSYAVIVEREGETVWRSPQVRHHRNAGWTTVLPGGEPGHAVRHDPRALAASGAFPPFDLSVPVNAAALADPAAGPVLPGHHGPVRPYMPTSGGRADIGLVTGWTAAWAKSQAPAAYAAMLHAADVGLTVPWHWAADGAPAFPDRFPHFWADYRGPGTETPFPQTVWSDEPGGWTTDLAHKPSLAFAAYVASAEPVYARALAHEAAYAVTGVWPAKRGLTNDIVLGDPQLRAAAWSLRDLGNAAWALPDADPMKPVLAATLSRNLAVLNQRLAGPEAGEMAGYLPGDRDVTPPWQQDFLAMVLAQEARRGTSGARAALRRMEGWLTGRVLGSGAGAPYAAAPEIAVARAGRPYTRWPQSVGATTAAPNLYRGGADDYYNVLLAALSLTHAVTGSPETAESVRLLLEEDGNEALTEPNNQLGLVWAPQFGIERP